ncbi:hypothetical protein PCASD_04747 [Puccinia coronata f. sp. avenae]|uniref:Uncharacterized protein n=1 Tax=Puccinia coronata f. sp. avenae TaxID=200324 RepID=A0A2N5V733_9BASI|nr:hypothetical protein PCASD_04747 [Puccinia coronata f. sp. avenae]
MAQSSNMSAPQSPAPRPPSSSVRVPTRQSTRIITPVKSQSSFIRPNQDSWQSLTRQNNNHEDNSGAESEAQGQSSQIKTPIKSKQPPKQMAPSGALSSQFVSNKSKPRNRKKRRITVDIESDSDNASNNQSDADVSIMDMTQDSDKDNEKIKKQSLQKTQGVAVDGFDNTEGPKLFYTCKWCAKVYKKGDDTWQNLKLHQDGNSTRAACPARKCVIQSGANLPITAKDQAAAKKEQEKDSTVMAKFIQSSSFDNRTLNQILVMWLIFSSLPWNRISNRLLGITFGYSRKGVGIYSRTWAASEA